MKLHIVLTAILLGVTLKLAVCKQKYEIVVDWKDTECDGGVALKEFL